MSVAVEAPGNTAGIEDSRQAGHSPVRGGGPAIGDGPAAGRLLRRISPPRPDRTLGPAGAVWILAEQDDFSCSTRSTCARSASTGTTPFARDIRNSSPGLRADALLALPAAQQPRCRQRRWRGCQSDRLRNPARPDRRGAARRRYRGSLLRASRRHAAADAMPFLVQMANWAALYARNHHIRQVIGQQHLWTQLEGLSVPAPRQSQSHRGGLCPRQRGPASARL